MDKMIIFETTISFMHGLLAWNRDLFLDGWWGISRD